MDENSTQGDEQRIAELESEQSRFIGELLYEREMRNLDLQTLDRTIKERDLAEEALRALTAAANALYEAGQWHCDREVDESAVWEALRDALGREAGKSPREVSEK